MMTIAEQLRQEGEQKGIQKGKLEAQLEIAKQMLLTGMDRQSIMKFTGLTDIEINRLFKD